MTRISSYSLHECPNCYQIHIKPEYGSISTSIPLGIYIEDSEIKVCKGCKSELRFKDYKSLGLSSKIKTRVPTKIEIWIRKILNKPYIELDVRKIYPLLD
jgi:hypothetical protein